MSAAEHIVASSRGTSVRRSIVLWIPIVLMAQAVIINVVQFPIIEVTTRHNYRALHAYQTGDVFEIAISHDNSARFLVAPFYYVGKLYPGSEVIIPSKGVKTWFDFDLSMRGFGKARNLIRAKYDPVTLLNGVDLDSYKVPVSRYAPAVGTTYRELDKRFAFFSGPEPSGRLIVITPDGRPERKGRIYFVDTAILPQELLKGLNIQ